MDVCLYLLLSKRFWSWWWILISSLDWRWEWRCFRSQGLCGSTSRFGTLWLSSARLGSIRVRMDRFFLGKNQFTLSIQVEWESKHEQTWSLERRNIHWLCQWHCYPTLRTPHWPKNPRLPLYASAWMHVSSLSLTQSCQRRRNEM